MLNEWKKRSDFLEVTKVRSLLKYLKNSRCSMFSVLDSSGISRKRCGDGEHIQWGIHSPQNGKNQRNIRFADKRINCRLDSNAQCMNVECKMSCILHSSSVTSVIRGYKLNHRQFGHEKSSAVIKKKFLQN